MIDFPPATLRSGYAMLEDEDYHVTGVKEVLRMVDSCGLTEKSRILEIGCGSGRLVRGIVSQLEGVEWYLGIDVREDVIDWCSEHITSHYPAFEFARVDVCNARYNPLGQRIDKAFQLPVDDDSVDIVYAWSVFSHMPASDIGHYLREFARVLSPGGWGFVTAFVEPDVPAETENPRNYLHEWVGPLHCVRLSEKNFYNMVKKAGLVVDSYVERLDQTVGQRGVYLRKKPVVKDGK